MSLKEYVVHLRSNGADPDLIDSTQSVLDRYTKWLNADAESENIVDHLERLFGRTRPLYIDVATFNQMVYRKAPKGHIADAMVSLGFTREVRAVSGIQMRIWVRGEWRNNPPAYGSVPPCPVPPPPS